MSESHLYFQVDAGLTRRKQVDLPVEVRRPNLTLAASGLTSQTLAVAPGVYFVTATMPGGQELVTHIEVAAGHDQTVHLSLAQADESATSGYDIFGYSSRAYAAPEADAPKGLESLTPAAGSAKLRRYHGNLLASDDGAAGARWTVPETWQLAVEDGAVVWTVPPEAAVSTLQLLSPGEPPLNIALPVDHLAGCRAILARDAMGKWQVDIELENTDADMLLRYRQHGLLKQAAAVAQSDSLQAESLLARKFVPSVGPMAAAVGAYALLSFGELDRLHNWTENLKNRFDYLPDGLSLRAEHLARLGDHAAALPLFLELPARGLPLFSDGLRFALDRLRIYLATGERYFKAEDHQRAATLLLRLESYAQFADFASPLLTFTGVDPRAPSAAPLAPAEYLALPGTELEL